MRSYLLISAICLQLGWSYGKPEGVGVYAYQDSAGNRYGGTYGLDDAQIYNAKDNAFVPPFMQDFQNFGGFFPEYFYNLENLLKEAFQTNFENQRLAYNAAQKAFDLTSNQAGYIPDFTNRFNNFGQFGGLGAFPGFGMNSAYAGGAVGPGYSHQVAQLNPENPAEPNVNVKNRFADTNRPGGNFYSVSSSSFASSSNQNGKEKSHRRAETVVNNNGEVTRYKISS